MSETKGVIDEVYCPVLLRKIDLGYCMELQMASDDMIIWDGMEDVFSEEQMKACRKCPKQEDPAAE